MNTWLSVGAAFALVAGAHAASAQGNTTPAREAAAREVVAVCKERESFEEYFSQIAEAQMADLRGANSNVLEAQWAAFEAILRTELLSRVDDYENFVVGINASHFTVDELSAMVDFCRTPAGRRISEVRVQIEAETFAVRQQWLKDAIAGATLRAAAAMRTEDKGL